MFLNDKASPDRSLDDTALLDKRERDSADADWTTHPWATDPLLTAVTAMQAAHHLFPHLALAATDDVGQSSPLHHDDGHNAHHQVVVVAVSGGADSCALLHTLQQLAPTWRLTLHVAHLDHALRADSATDAAFVAELVSALGLPFHKKTLQPGELAVHGGSVEAAARHARYAFLAHVALAVTPATQQPIVAVAHHADDQAETVLHHLIRGSGLAGLAGMQPVTAYSPADSAELTGPQAQIIPNPAPRCLRLVRPLLYVRRATILQFLQNRRLTWREDSTNEDQRYTRNYLRHTVLPALAAVNPQVVEAIGRMATLTAAESARLAAYDAQLLHSLQWPTTNEPVIPAHASRPVSGETLQPRRELVLNLALLRAQPVATQRALLRLACAQVAPLSSALSFEQLTQLCRALTHAGSGGPHPIVGALQWSVAGAFGDRPPLVSIHRKGTLPFGEGRPLLAAGAVLRLPAVALDECHTMVPVPGWQMTISAMTRAAMTDDWRAPSQPWRAFFDRAQLPQPQLTTAIAGQMFAPLGLNGHHKAIGDLFTDRKIPTELRPHWPLLVDATTGEVHWVCGLQPGHRARITAATEEVLAVHFAQVDPDL